MSNHESHPVGPDRRRFLQAGVVAAGALAGSAAFVSAARRAQAEEVKTMEIPRRKFGRHDDQVSILGLGGFHLGKAPSHDEAMRIAHEAIEAGINFFDNAWEYNEHRSEQWMGDALRGRRDKVFLMTKVCTHGRDKKVAMQQLEESLSRLQTDHLDLWQVHEVVYDNDPELHFAEGGVFEALDLAKKQGKVRYVGFTGHKRPEIHLKMLAHEYAFDSVQMPLNCFDASFHSFERNVLPVVNQRGIAALGMKSLSGNADPVVQGVVSAAEALRYAMSLPVTVTISGIDSLAVLKQNLDLARGFVPMTDAEMAALRRRCAAMAGDGHLELYKSSTKYDAEVGRQQHGYPTIEQMPL